MTLRRLISSCGVCLGLLVVVGFSVPDDRPGGVPQPLTARQVVERVKAHVTCEWQTQTVDTFKAGDPDTPVKGIACTFMATFDVLKRAHQAGCNFIITHEPTFYDGHDDTSQLEPDAIVEAKRKFIADHGLVVWRFHDHIHRTEPDGITTGMIDLFGWKPWRRADDALCFQLPESSSVADFASGLKTKFNRSAIRVVGDPNMKFRKFGLSVGAPGSIAQMRMLQRDDVDVLVAGETREWETVEYVRDTADMGRGKALILLGHCISEEAGMAYCVGWLRAFVSEVPVQFIPAGDPFWTP